MFKTEEKALRNIRGKQPIDCSKNVEIKKNFVHVAHDWYFLTKTKKNITNSETEFRNHFPSHNDIHKL